MLPLLLLLMLQLQYKPHTFTCINNDNTTTAVVIITTNTTIAYYTVHTILKAIAAIDESDVLSIS